MLSDYYAAGQRAALEKVGGGFGQTMGNIGNTLKSGFNAAKNFGGEMVQTAKSTLGLNHPQGFWSGTMAMGGAGKAPTSETAMRASRAQQPFNVGGSPGGAAPKTMPSTLSFPSRSMAPTQGPAFRGPAGGFRPPAGG